jgi:hypothetical protein
MASPDPQSLLLEQDDEWTVAERGFSAESMKQAATPTLSTTAQEILATLYLTGHYQDAQALSHAR